MPNAGDGQKPHPCVGKSRVIPVRDRQEQWRELNEAVQNHNPQARLHHAPLTHRCSLNYKRV